MNTISNEVLNHHKIRKNVKQKAAFRALIQAHAEELGYPVSTETSGIFKSTNLIIGELERADIVLSAHYDTCATLFVPNFITPRNHFVTIIYQLFIAIPFLSFISFVSIFTLTITSNPIIQLFGIYLALFLIDSLVYRGIPNKNNYNDNTSGVITLIELMNHNTPDSRIAYVFFDHEEIGLKGSRQFSKKHNKKMMNTLLINFDCVSDGDHIAFVLNKQVRADKSLCSLLSESITSEGEKEVHMFPSSSTFYPSDQKKFQKAIAVAALKKNKLVGYYLDKIHTKRDVNFDEKNIIFLIKNISAFTDIYLTKEN